MSDFVIIIPYYNDKSRINYTLDEILKWKTKNKLFTSVYIIDDGSNKVNKIILKKNIEIIIFFT